MGEGRRSPTRLCRNRAVEVTNGEFRIDFTRQTESPAINAIEIIPQTEAAAGAAYRSDNRIKAGLSTPFTDSSGHVWQPDRGFAGGGMGGIIQMPGGFGGGPGGFGGGGGGRPGGFGGGFGGFGGGGGAAYASAIAIDFEGQRQYVQLTANASSSALPRPTANSCGAMTSLPIGWASAAQRQSIKMAWSSPPRPMAEAVGW